MINTTVCFFWATKLFGLHRGSLKPIQNFSDNTAGLSHLYRTFQMIPRVTTPTRHSMSSEGVIIFFILFYKHIAFKLVQSYNVKHLTCTISCSSGLQNIYKLHTWKCLTFTIFTLLHLFTKNIKDITYTK